MRTFVAEFSKVVRNRKRKFRRSFRNKIKRNRGFHRMSTHSNCRKSTPSSDIISLIDDEENENQSTVGRLSRITENVQSVPRENKIGYQERRRRKQNPRLKELSASNVVDLSNDQEQYHTRRGSVLQTTIKRNLGVVCGDNEVSDCKTKIDSPATDISGAVKDIKIIGLDSDTASHPSNTSEIVVLPTEDNTFLGFRNVCSWKQKAIPVSSSDEVKNKSSSSERGKIVTEELQTNNSVIILDSDDETSTSPTSGDNYIPLKRKRLDASVEVLDHVRKVPQSPELCVVKHISPSLKTSSQQSATNVMFEDRTGNYELFHDANFWKQLKENSNKPKQKVRNAKDVTQLSQPVRQRDDSNIYNPTPAPEKGGLRPVIIDGNNVAWGHGNHKYFSAPGLEICINYFVQRKHRVIAFVPQYRKTRKVPGLIEMLDKYEGLGQVVITPSRKIDGKTVSSYDDRYIVQAAAELGGVIVSTDNYRDLMAENQRWKETIEKRLLMFTWVGDMLMFPQDPLGRDGPTLEEFLRFPK